MEEDWNGRATRWGGMGAAASVGWGGGGHVGSLGCAHSCVNEIGDWEDELGFGGFIRRRWISAHFHPSARESTVRKLRAGGLLGCWVDFRFLFFSFLY